MSAPFSGIKACVFDAYGTLFDVHAPLARMSQRIGDKASQLSQLWRQKQLEYTWLRSLMREHVNFWQVTNDALDYALSVLEHRGCGAARETARPLSGARGLPRRQALPGGPVAPRHACRHSFQRQSGHAGGGGAVGGLARVHRRNHLGGGSGSLQARSAGLWTGPRQARSERAQADPVRFRQHMGRAGGATVRLQRRPHRPFRIKGRKYSRPSAGIAQKPSRSSWTCSPDVSGWRVCAPGLPPWQRDSGALHRRTRRKASPSLRCAPPCIQDAIGCRAQRMQLP